MKRHLAFATLMAALLAGACQVLVGIEDEIGVPVFPVCLGEQPPGPPRTLGVDAPELPDSGIYLAIDHVYSARDGGAKVGYNLDLRCTSADAADADSPCEGSPDDLEGGVDNAFFANYIDGLPPILGTGSSDPGLLATNAGIRAGTGGILIVLRSYNGAADDSRVGAAIISTAGHVRTTPEARPPCSAGTLADASGGGNSGEDGGPLWNGCDVWPVVKPDASFDPGYDFHWGYVTNHVLVVSYESLLFRLGGSELRLRNALLTGKIEKREDGTYRIDEGIIAGRVSAEDAITSAALSEVTYKGARYRLCQGGQDLVDILRKSACRARDVRMDGKSGGRCDGVSIGVGFTALPIAEPQAGGTLPELSTCEVPFDASCPP